MTPADIDAFIAQETAEAAPPLVPELKLRLARNGHAIFSATHTFDEAAMRPYWAFAWPGGQALARYILDNPAVVSGKRVVDVGAGSGLGALAAVLAGARSALAADTDVLACAACRLNARANALDLAVTSTDLLGNIAEADIVLIGDLVYEPELKDRVGAFLAGHVARGVNVLYGDRTTARRPPGNFRLLAEYEAPLTPALVDDFAERARVWQL